VPQDEVTIGIPYDRPDAVTLGRILVEPFGRQPAYRRGRLVVLHKLRLSVDLEAVRPHRRLSATAFHRRKRAMRSPPRQME
jgi:hypothetical protein